VTLLQLYDNVLKKAFVNSDTRQQEKLLSFKDYLNDYTKSEETIVKGTVI
jgi:hypothetical protein